ncbi:MAG: creatininase family protein [Gammaproteobacteria bacterium]
MLSYEANMIGRYLESMSWPEAEAALKNDPIVLLPVGARCKEHGPHLPLNTDWLQAEYFSRRLLERMDLLALPTVQYGYYPAFVDYPGSTHLDERTFLHLLGQICDSMWRHGARRFYILNMGISTLPTLETLSIQMKGRGAAFGYTNPATLVLDLEKALASQPRGGHADELETSVMLAIAPECVRMGLAPTDLNEYQGKGPFRRRNDEGSGLYSPSGIWGDASLADREKGEVLVEAMLQALEDEIRRL